MQLIDKLEGTIWKDPHQKYKNNKLQTEFLNMFV